MNSKMSLDLAANQDFVSADQFSSYNEWSTMNWLNYQFWPRLNAALGAGGGYDNESASPDMSFEQFQGRVNWRATDKLGFQLHGGVEVRQFLSGGQSPLVNPIFDGTIQYQPFEQTKISVTGSSVVGSSILAERSHRNHERHRRPESAFARQIVSGSERRLPTREIRFLGDGHRSGTARTITTPSMPGWVAPS